MSVRVTSHAIIRYLTRVRLLDESEIRQAAGEGASDHGLAKAGCAMLNQTLAEVAAEILPRHLEAAVILGASRIQRAGFALACREGFVTTVVDGANLCRPGHHTAQGWHPRAQRRRERRPRFLLSEHMAEGETP
ncbi:hypothetical protein [Aureimonas phyllosphaerae]|uniref:Uncharacterized protein n=1 Tax=Aureimonas phyllosphaerae TaxID=1166078 RepID=A0A7W6FX40_9HYPH|nr:hypothetical protein [Aureimonas phyllosphaerae]MBB3937697.1 hypothetical protein [Aureimonas phyllosphaerae]MBB3961768.1 hypothetical protein [Aureimonas phyllosphaerae]SFF45179.1 hypothetical protein SAMN05216566_11435 [Aureimonas phyllosphaerae]